MIAAPHRPQCILQQTGRHLVNHKAFDSLTVKYKDPPKSLQTGGRGLAAEGGHKACASSYKSAGGILRHKTKFDDYRYALVQGHSHGKWSFPKGHLQDKETPYTCAMREIAEETGIDMLPLPITSLQIGFGYYYIFEVEEEYPLRPRDKEEIMATKWVTLEEMQRMDVNTDVSQYVRMFMS